jgi:hypothetical protein
MMNSEKGFGMKVLKVLFENGVSFEHMPSGIDTMSVIVRQKDFAEKEQLVISRIEELCEPDHMDIESDFALIAVVGRGMKSTRGTAGRLFAALAHAHINVKMIDQGSSELNIIIAVSNDDFENAVRAIYQIFVDAKSVLQELVQKDSTKTLSYEICGESGPEHDKIFKSRVLINGEILGEGEGHTKKAAEQQAAYQAVLKIKDKA